METHSRRDNERPRRHGAFYEDGQAVQSLPLCIACCRVTLRGVIFQCGSPTPRISTTAFYKTTTVGSVSLVDIFIRHHRVWNPLHNGHFTSLSSLNMCLFSSACATCRGRGHVESSTQYFLVVSF